jgi:hypothetical protein
MDDSGLVVGKYGQFAENAAFEFVGSGDEGVAPRSPEIVHEGSFKFRVSSFNGKRKAGVGYEVRGAGKDTAKVKSTTPP